MRVINKKGTVIIFEEDNQYGVKDLETDKEICKRSKYIQEVKEEFEHYWRRKYLFKESENSGIFSDEKGFFDWNSSIMYE
ncbi:MAG: hypothetical protein HWN67_19705 [Candidatus Helarchaeota archaeon]|nr:hypothetical protein [Candidatus Helarchaeota archaeon]